MRVDNPELQERQQRLVVEQGRTRTQERELLRGRERAPAQEIDSQFWDGAMSERLDPENCPQCGVSWIDERLSTGHRRRRR